ncbi:MAG TPA: NAD-dependent epimerase/dehydratase family protein, partial [Acidimicrobiales bacterium]|nr:NAD-dependent epimerase/dehydratase family protein [Acidimicrobiales bacterium]
RPDSPYAQVVPLFVEALGAGAAPIVHGDGCQIRAFVFVEDAVSATLAAAGAPARHCDGHPYNVAGARSVDLLEVLDMLGSILDVDPRPVHVGSRPGDVRHTSADISAAARDLGFEPAVDLEEGLRRTVDWLSGVSGLAQRSAVQS